MGLLENALDLAARVHANQFRTDGQPYITHPIAVQRLVRQHGITDEDILAIAILHDVIEDGYEDDDEEDTYEEFVELFNDRIANGVSRLSRKPNQTYEDFIQSIVDNPTDIAVVKVYDIIHNLSGSPSPKKVHQYISALTKLLPLI